MANLHNEFGIFHDRIALTHSRIANLKHAREEIRDRISLYFLNRGMAVPEFHSQGALGTMTNINPLNQVYAIDDGIYLQHLDRHDVGRWPLPEMVHRWVIDAVRGHAGAQPVGCNTCVRLTCAGEYRIDLRIYAELNRRLYLAECSRGWHWSDPLALTDWFSGGIQRQGEQLRRMIRYFKAWADFRSRNGERMPSGLILSVFAVRNFAPYTRDDFAMLHLLGSLDNDVDALVYLLNPIDFDEELTAQLSGEEKRCFQLAVEDAVADAVQAVETNDRLAAAMLWRKQFGDRFPSP